MNINNNLRLAYDYYTYLLLNRRVGHNKPKKSFSTNLFVKAYHYSTLFLFLNFFNTIDYLKYKYFNKPIIEHKHLYEGFNKEQSIGLETLKLFKQSLNMRLLLNKNIIHLCGFISHLYVDPSKPLDYLKLFALSLLSAPCYRNIHEIIINKHFGGSVNIIPLVTTFKLSVPYYYVLSTCDNFIVICFYFSLLNYMKKNVLNKKEEVIIYEDHLAMFKETIKNNPTFNRIEELYRHGVLKEFGVYDEYLYTYMPGLIFAAGVITALVYTPVDYLLQSYLFDGKNIRAFRNTIFENKELVLNRLYIVSWMNFFRFSFQYGIFFMINELYKVVN
jgi:hypothetical protein